ncbi:MAG: hypothetical protein GY719_07315 [bacterium]|nr:hypothetical protein [bacterium]
MLEAQSDRILDLVQSAVKVETEIDTHTEEIGARLDEEFAPAVTGWDEGQPRPDFRTQFKALKAKLGFSREQLSTAEEHTIDLVKQGVELRTERTVIFEGLYEDFSSMRRTVEELYRGKGKGNANVFVIAGIQGPTSQVPTKLLRQVDLAIRHLRQPDLEFPAARFDGTRLEPSQLLQVLEPYSVSMHDVQGALGKVASELNASRKEKNRAMASHKITFKWVARTAESLFELAGEHELAERIRPSARRPGRRAVEVANEGESESASQDGDGQDGDVPASSAPAQDTAESASGDGGSGEPTGESEPTASPAVDTAAEPAPSSSDG